MIARDRDVVAHRIHQLDDRLAGGQRADRFALNRVAVVNEHHIIPRSLQAVAHGRQTGIAEALVDAAVRIAGEEHHNVAGERSRFRKRSASKQHRHRQQQTQNPFHDESLLFRFPESPLRFLLPL